MEIVDAVWLDSIAGGRGNHGGDRTDNSGRNKSGSRSNNKSGSGNYYANNTSADCINGMGVGAA